MEWGNEIAVNGVRPDWLRDDESMQYQTSARSTFHDMTWGWGWGVVGGSIRLPADHPYYTVQRYNEQHGTSFVYWPGGDAAPADWDGKAVLFNDACVQSFISRWDHWVSPNARNIIGYTRRSEPARDTVAVERRTAKGWVEYCQKVTGSTYLTPDELELFKALGLVIETEAERIAAETGVPVETVQRVLDARS